jgi:uncharacterized protein YkwD
MKNKNFLQTIFAVSAILLFGTVFNTFGRENSYNSLSKLNESKFSFLLLPDVAEFDIFDLVNQERHRKRLNDLEWNDALANLARNYSRKMARENFFDHYDSNGQSVIERAKSARLKNWSKIGENLFYCEGLSNYSSFAVKGWLNSSSHRRNMLDREWRETGIGVAKGRSGKVYVTQVFIK